MKKEARGWWYQPGSRGIPWGPVEWEEPLPPPPSLKVYRGAGVSGELHLRIGASRVRHQGPIITGAVM